MIKDNELIKWGRTMVHRGEQEAIIALRHCDFNEPSYQDLKIMEKLSRVIEYFYHLRKVNRLTEKAFDRHYLQLRQRGETISKLRRGSHTYHAALPGNFFQVGVMKMDDVLYEINTKSVKDDKFINNK